MNTDAIAGRILDDARAATEQMLRDARDRADALKRDAERRIDELRVRRYNQVEVDIRQQRGHMLRMAEQEQRRALLGAKREVIDQVFDAVLGAMQSMPEPQRRAYNRRLLLEAARGGERIAHDEADAALFDDAFLRDVNAALAASGRRPVSICREHRPTGGGFILISEGVEAHCTYPALLAHARPELEAEASRMLFEG